ncbi:MAG: GNAT family N-acetyltransferase [Bacteroidetes bacterium]|nr:GNAT family N-acetyltransferase [Bacteroidota bacterium]
MILEGEKVQLRPTSVEEIPIFFKFATDSHATPYWYGDLYGDKIPTYDEFIADWKRYYFDGSAPELGRSFLIIVDGNPVGQVNYNDINRTDNSVELDIIIADDNNKGKGLGSDALKTLVKYLFQEMNIKVCCIDAIATNPRAIRAYEKAGFAIENEFEKNGNFWKHMVLRSESY